MFPFRFNYFSEVAGPRGACVYVCVYVCVWGGGGGGGGYSELCLLHTLGPSM